MILEQWKAYQVGLTERSDAVISVPARLLTEPSAMEAHLRQYAPLMKALELPAAAAYFCANFAFVALTLQLSISLNSTAPDLSLDNITVQLYPDNGKFAYWYKLERYSAEAAPTCEHSRSEWIKEKQIHFYRHTVRPLFEAVSAVGGLGIAHLWGLLPTKFNYHISDWIDKAKTNEQKQRIAEDYSILIRHVPAEAFGRAKNPFDVSIRWLEDLRDPAKQVRMKNVCCMYYRTEGGQYCYTCPRMDEQARAERRDQAREQQVVTVAR